MPGDVGEPHTNQEQPLFSRTRTRDTAGGSGCSQRIPEQRIPEQRIPEHSALAAPADRGTLNRKRSRVAVLAFILYLATLSADAIRKVTGLPTSILGVIYVITALIYIYIIAGTAGQKRAAPRAVPRTLPVWLLLLSLWCLAVALVQHIPIEMTLLGWASYVFFVPLLYVGAELAADDRLAVKALQVVAISGGLVGAGAIASALLGQSAPALLQPIVPSAGIHTFTTGNIHLSPSVFATGEEASEQLLIALFAWIALARLASGISRRKLWVLLGAFIAAGLIVAARRASIDVAIAGVVAALILGRTRATQATRVGQLATGMASRLGAAVFLIAAGSVAVVLFVGDAGLVSFLTSGSPGSRISAALSLPGSGSPVGQGTGTSTQGVTLVNAASLTIPVHGSGAGYVMNGRTFIAAEGGLAKTWLELGIMGLVLYGAVFWAALAPAVRSLRRLDGAGVALTMLAIALGVVFLKGHQSLDDPLIQPLFWLAVGGIWGRMQAAAVSGRPGRDRPGQGLVPRSSRPGGHVPLARSG